ncbi:MAG: HepT-like ribonuclease domain-containing protein [Armatimonadota bacterium]
MRRDELLYLQDIVEAADDIADFIAGLQPETFASSNLVQSAVLQKLLVIGEAAAHVSQQTSECHSKIEWSDIVAFRNFAVHAYFAVDWDRVWDAATMDAPLLRNQIQQIINESSL